MTAEGLAVLGGVLLSLAFRYVPGLAPWFEAKTSAQKALAQAGFTLLAAAGVFALSCTGRYAFVVCDGGGALELAELFAKALAGNQVAHLITNPARPYKAGG
jgi:hypothetical protein